MKSRSSKGEEVREYFIELKILLNKHMLLSNKSHKKKKFTLLKQVMNTTMFINLVAPKISDKESKTIKQAKTTQ